MANSWFLRNSYQDPTLPSSYTVIEGDPSCSGGDRVCAIYAAEQTIGGETKPVIGDDELKAMARSLDSHQNSDHVELKNSSN